MKKITIFGLIMIFLIGIVSAAVSLTDPGAKTPFENSTLTFTLAATGVGPFTFTKTGVGSLDPSTGVFTYMPGFEESTQTTNKVNVVTFTVVDANDSTSDSKNVSITVLNLNRAPVANAGSDKSVDVNKTATLTGSGSDADNDALTFLWSVVSSPETVTLSSTTATSPTFTPTKLGQYKFSLVANDGDKNSVADEVIINVEAGNKLQVTDLDVKVVHAAGGSDTDKNICNDTECESNGYNIREDVEPGDTVEFSLEITNLYTDDEDFEIRDVFVEITLENIDDGDDLDDESDEQDIDADSNEDFDIDFDLPFKIDEGSYDVIIKIEGEDENTGKNHELNLRYNLNVDKQKHDIRIVRADLRSSTLTCSRRTDLDVEVINVGSDDEDEVRITAKSEELGLDFEERDIELDEGVDDSDHTESISIDARDVSPGEYTIDVDVYYDDTRRSKKDTSQTVVLTVAECREPTQPVVSEPEEEEPEEVEVIVKPAEPTVSVPPVTGFPVVAQVEGEEFTESSAYVVLLSLGGLVLAVLIVVIIVLLVKKR